MKKTIGLILALACLLGGMPVRAASVENLVDFSKTDALPMLGQGCFSVLLMEAGSGSVLYENNAHESHPIASVTKVMTLLLVVEAIEDGRISKDDLVSVSENAASKGGSQIYLEVGEQMSVHDLLKAVFVASANDGAVALAEFVGGSEAAFVAAMNERSRQLGLSTVFVNPTGLDDEECHESTAYDVAVISRELLQHEWVMEYTTIWMDSVRDGQFGLTNTNRLVRFYDGATGLKTGSTSKAKYCVSASAKRGDLHLIAVVLGGETSDRRFAAAKELLDYGFANYAVYLPKASGFEDVGVFGGVENAVTPIFEKSGILVEKGKLNKITEEVLLQQQLNAPVEAGQVIGEVIYRCEGEELARHRILSREGVEKATFAFVLRKLIRIVFFSA